MTPTLPNLCFTEGGIATTGLCSRMRNIRPMIGHHSEEEHIREE